MEECCSYFGYGHAASLAENALSREGIATAIDLAADIEIKSVIGAPTRLGRTLRSVRSSAKTIISSYQTVREIHDCRSIPLFSISENNQP
uniref:Uncharacterized protein n=1 Tax=Agrobacterium tumefaciens TaxID=358 RepID=A0A2Z2PNB1_AGRTU|nr:hypothetical protein [Agrobacterium tumefaciens]ASK47129.1 hypothetical protein [Agrobacterium radiobacter]